MPKIFRKNIAVRSWLAERRDPDILGCSSRGLALCCRRAFPLMRCCEFFARRSDGIVQKRGLEKITASMFTAGLGLYRVR